MGWDGMDVDMVLILKFNDLSLVGGGERERWRDGEMER